MNRAIVFLEGDVGNALIFSFLGESGNIALLFLFFLLSLSYFF